MHPFSVLSSQPEDTFDRAVAVIREVPAWTLLTPPGLRPPHLVLSPDPVSTGHALGVAKPLHWPCLPRQNRVAGRGGRVGIVGSSLEKGSIPTSLGSP